MSGEAFRAAGAAAATARMPPAKRGAGALRLGLVAASAATIGATRLDVAGFGDAHVLISAFCGVSWRSIRPAFKGLIFLARIRFSTLSCGSKSWFWNRHLFGAFRPAAHTISLSR